MKCSRCGGDNLDGNVYCGRCGATMAAPSPEPARYLDRDALLRREVVIVLVGIALVLAAAWGAWYLVFARRSPQATVLKFVEADRQGDYAAEEQFVSARPDSRFVLSLLQEYRKQGGGSPFQKARIVNSWVSGRSAQVTVEVVLTAPPAAPLPGRAAPAPGPPPKYQVAFYLVNEDGEWKIDPTQTAMGFLGMLAAAGYQQVMRGANPLIPPPGVLFPGFGAPPAPTAPPTSTPPPGPSGI